MYVEPGQDVNNLAIGEQRDIVRRAASDLDYLGELGVSKRRDVLKAAHGLPNPDPWLLRCAILAMINNETALAAEQGRYDEWPQLRDAVMSRDRHARRFLELLKGLVESGAVLAAVWTCGEVRPGEPRVMRAIFRITRGREFKLEEFWPRHDRREGYPEVKIFCLEEV